MIWCWGTILFYTLVATKYITYTYIAVPPAILLAVLALKDFLAEDGRKAQAALVGPYLLTLAALLAGTFYLPGNFISFYVIAAYSGFLLLTQWKKKQLGSMLILTTASMAVGLTCLVFGGLTNYVATRSSSTWRSISTACRDSTISSRAIPRPTPTTPMRSPPASTTRA